MTVDREKMAEHFADGIGFGSLLGLAFVVLRLCHVIAWPWVWVLAPFWVPLALLLLIIVIVLAVAVVKKS